MFRHDRYFNKNDRQHNYFGEGAFFENKDGTIKKIISLKESPPKQKKAAKQKAGG